MDNTYILTVHTPYEDEDISYKVGDTFEAKRGIGAFGPSYEFEHNDITFEYTENEFMGSSVATWFHVTPKGE